MLAGRERRGRPPASSASHAGFRPAAVARQLLSQHTAQRVFEILFGRFRKGAQRRIDERLIAAASGLVNLLSKPLEDIVVDPDGDSRLARRGAKNSAAPAILEVVLFLHLVPS